MRLTKGNVQKVLKQNEGFTQETSHSSRNFSFDRIYKIIDGKLNIRETSKTSWADSRENQNWVADEKEAHDFVYKFKNLLNTDGIE